jgi:formylglycine-generating enzyme required for sulfatase activity
MKTTANGYRLPTEAEWEYAARGGGTPSTTGTFAYKWAGTTTESDLVNYAWYSGNAGSATHPVGGKTANGAGLYDMSGNVYEWCWDWLDVFIYTGTATDPAGPTSGTGRVRRGGSWDYPAPYCAVAYRASGARGNNLGFRLVMRP